MGQSIQFVLIFSLLSLFPGSQCQTEECCSTKVVENSPDPSLDGTYTLASDGEKREDICIDGCVYNKGNGGEYCFISKPMAESSDVACEDGTTASAGSIESLNDAAALAKDEALSAAAEIFAADAAINAGNEAFSQLDKLDPSQFGGGLRLKRQNTNYPAPTTCDSVLMLMDDIIDTLKNNPASVTPLIDALEVPLASPCSADDISKLSTKKDTAKSTATAAVSKQTNLKAAAIEKYNTANEKLKSLNEQIAAQGGSTIAAGTAAPTVATMSTLSEATGDTGSNGGSTVSGITAATGAAAGGKVCSFPTDPPKGQHYTINIKTNEAGIWKLVFDQSNVAISLTILGQEGIEFSCSSFSSSSSSATTECISGNSVLAGTYAVKV